jgi:cysteine synthase
VGEQTRRELLAQAEEEGDLRWGTEEESRASAQRVGVMLALIGASREYQFT